MGPLGIPELIFIFILALLIFGPKKLPELGRTVGKAMTEFRRASNDLRYAFEDEVRELERQAREVGKGVEEAVIAPPGAESHAPASGAAAAEPRPSTDDQSTAK